MKNHHLLVFLILLSFQINGLAQITVTSQGLPDEPFFYYKKNPVWFKHSTPDSDTLWLIPDVLNVCRVKSNRIKMLEIYKFNSRSDSSLFKTIYYNKFGLIDSLSPSQGWKMYYDFHIYDTLNIDCDSLFREYKLYSTKNVDTIIHFNGRQRTQHSLKFDSLGYLIEIKDEKMGLLKKGYLFNGTTNYKKRYQYENNYTSVRISYCHVERGNIEKYCDFGTEYFYYVLDSKKNLKAELYLDESDPDKYSGFKYYYSYY